jgi:spermidine/putrescine transport system ATP-binding protein
MNEGRIEQMGVPLELYRRPGTPAVRDSLGRTVMFHGQVTQRELSGSVTVQLQDDRGPLVKVNPPNRADLETGAACVVAVRPESIEITPANPAHASGINTVMGVIETLLFIGDRYQATVALPWGQSTLIHLPPAGKWAEGQDVALHLPPDGIQLWPARG